MEPDLAIVVVTYNSATVIGDLLASLPAALDGLSADVVVVDNGSSDETVVTVEQTGNRVVRSTNEGYAAGINRGVGEAAKAPAILVLNPDVRLHPGSVRRLFVGLDVPGTGIVAPKVLNEDGTVDQSLRRDPTLLRALGLGRTGRARLAETVAEETAYGQAHVVDWALGAVLLVSRQCHEALGGWDESFFLYSEETDLSLRARELGFATRYEPDAVVVHIGRASGYNAITHAMMAVNRVRLYRRRHRAVPSFLYLVANVVGETSWVLRGERFAIEAIKALLMPSHRPTQLGCSDRLLPR